SMGAEEVRAPRPYDNCKPFIRTRGLGWSSAVALHSNTYEAGASAPEVNLTVLNRYLAVLRALGSPRSPAGIGHLFLQPVCVAAFEVHKLPVKRLEFGVFRDFAKSSVVAHRALLGGDGYLESHFARRTSDSLQFADGENLSAFQPWNLDQIANIVLRHCAGASAVAIEITLLQHRAVMTLLVCHIPKGAGDFQGLRIVELGKKLGKLMVDLSVTFFDKDGDVQGFLGRQRGEVAVHAWLLKDRKGSAQNTCLDAGLDM